MFKKSDYFILLAVVIGDREQSIFTAIWVPSIFCFGIYFKLSAILNKKL